MNIYNWFFIFNADEFDALNLVSKTYTVILDGDIGQKDILVTEGNFLSMLYDGVFLVFNLNNKNPFEASPYACYIDGDRNAWLGILQE